MACSDFTLAQLRERFGLTIREPIDLSGDLPPAEIPPFLVQLLKRQVPLARRLASEKARSELIIAPILLKIEFLAKDHLGFFSGVDFPVDAASGLVGRCEFLRTRDLGQLDINAPVCVVVEAKNDNINAGIPQQGDCV